MNKKNSPAAGHNKKSFLNKHVEHIDITKFDARDIIDSMSKMSFTSRDTANAAKIFNEMIEDKSCSIFLTLAGSTSAGGCMKLYSDLVKYNMVDAVVATGASIFTPRTYPRGIRIRQKSKSLALFLNPEVMTSNGRFSLQCL